LSSIFFANFSRIVVLEYFLKAYFQTGWSGASDGPTHPQLSTLLHLLATMTTTDWTGAIGVTINRL
jgi:hypothetical protein